MTLPTYWTWATPLGAAVDHARIVEMTRVRVRSNLGLDLGPTDSADLVSDFIVDRGFDTPHIGILLQAWGDQYGGSTHALWRNPSDQVSGSDVPYFAQGISDATAWTDSFVARYVANGSPDPYAFWMDTETRITVNNLFPVWSDFKADSRWSTEVCFPNSETWADQNIADPANASNLSDPANQTWINEVRVALFVSQSWAMDQAFFTPVRAQWPSVLTANWRTTHDGYGLDGSALSNVHYQTVGGTHQSAVLYGNSNPQTSGPNRSDYAAQEYPLKITQSGLPWPQRPHAPWILLYGEGGDIAGDEAIAYYNATIGLGSRNGIRHFLVWADTTSTNYESEASWNSFVDAISKTEIATRDRGIQYRDTTTFGHFRPFNHPGL